jgi:hypothetical protein
MIHANRDVFLDTQSPLLAHISTHTHEVEIAKILALASADAQYVRFFFFWAAAHDTHARARPHLIPTSPQSLFPKLSHPHPVSLVAIVLCQGLRVLCVY